VRHPRLSPTPCLLAQAGGILNTISAKTVYLTALLWIVSAANAPAVHAWQPDPTLQIIGGIFEAIGNLEPPEPQHLRPDPYYVQPQYPNPYYVRPQPRPPVVTPPPPPKPVEPQKNKVAPQPTKPQKNENPLNKIKKADGSLLKGLQAQVDSLAFNATAEIQEQINRRQPTVEVLVATISQSKPLNERQMILDRARMGDVGFIVLATAGDNSTEAQQLRQYATAVESLKQVDAATRQGNLLDPTRRQLTDSLVSGGFISSTGPLMAVFNRLDVANGVAGIVSGSHPNATVTHLNTLLYVGSMPARQVLFLGGAAALVGTGGESQGVILTSGSLGQAVGMNTEAGSPVPEDDNDPLLSGTIIKNTGPSEVNFVVGAKRASLAPDQAKVYKVSDGDMIEFYKSEKSEKTRYKLEDACYEFRQSSSAWGLYKVKYSVTIDNTDNSGDFRYVALNEQSLVKAGEKKTIESSHPIVLRFDNGNDSVRQKRISKGTFKVGMNSKGHLDLYTTEDVKPVAPTQEVIETESINLFGNWSNDGPIVATPYRPTPPQSSGSNSPQLFK
jgi:hypothetical protein